MSRGAYGYVYLNLEDRRRMARYFGLETQQFTRRYCDKSEGHFHLKQPEKDCRFLDGKQCSVYEARPTQCRTWPFWRSNLRSQRTWAETCQVCPGSGQGNLIGVEEILEQMAQIRV